MTRNNLTRARSSLPSFWTRTNVIFAVAFFAIAIVGAVTVLVPEIRGSDGERDEQATENVVALEPNP